MKKNILIVVGLALVVGLGGWWFVNDNKNIELVEVSIQEDSNTETVNMADTRCTFTQTVSGVESSGIVHMSGDRVQGKFSSEVVALGASIESNMLHLDGWVYSWSSMSDQGFKSASSLDLTSEKEDLITEAFAVPEGVELEYHCEPWQVDQSIFILPISINFIEA